MLLFLRISLVVLFLSAMFTPAFGAIIPINLNDFFVDGDITISADGGTATFQENEFWFSALLANDPGQGDLGIAVPDNLLSLSFDYSFVEADGNSDEFRASLFDPNDYFSPLFEIFIETSEARTFTWDLSSLGSSLTLLGMEFQLDSLDMGIGSSLVISNVVLETQDVDPDQPPAAPVPEPSTLLLLGSGLLSLPWLRRKFSKAKK